MNNLYGNDFHKNRHEKTNYAANSILSIVLEHIPKVESAIDIGCGVGTWLNMIKKLGVKNILGIDGDWVDRNALTIPENNFISKDLNAKLNLNKKFNLAISLEVAEHLKPQNSEKFVASLVDISDFILFSAAHPYQGGVGHINEQWPNYWINIFEGYGYVALDVVRKKIWQDKNIPTCYKKNILLYVRNSRVSDLPFDNISNYTPPEKYLLYFEKLTKPGIKQSFNNFIVAVSNRIRG